MPTTPTTYWTLTYYDPAGDPPVEKTLADWQIHNCRMDYVSQDMDTCEFGTAGGHVDDADTFAFGGTCVIQEFRTQNPDGTFSGGIRRFYGRVTETPHSASGKHEGIHYRLSGPWWYLENRTFEVQWNLFAGYTVPTDPRTAPLFTQNTIGHLWLNRDLYGIHWICTGEQIENAVKWAISHGAPIQLLPDVPVVLNAGLGLTLPAFRTAQISAGILTSSDVPPDEIVDSTCAEVIRKQARWNPDIVTWFDYTTLPFPTFHCVRRANLTPVAMNLLDGVQITEAGISARYDLQKPFVRIVFEQENSYNGQQFMVPIVQVWPTPQPSETALSFGGLSTTVRISGQQINTTSVVVQTNSLPALGDIPGMTALLLDKQPWLNPPTDGSAPSVQAVTVLSVARASNLGFVIAADSAQFPDWITLNNGNPVQTAKDKLIFTVNIVSSNGQVDTKVLTVEINSTNLDTGGVKRKYTKVTSLVAAEPIPPNLAHEMYDALNVLQYSGEATYVRTEAGFDVQLGQVVSFPDVPQYAGMNAVVQRVHVDVDSGRTTFRFGPNKLLSVGDYVTLLQVTRNRFVYNAPSMRSGASGAGGETSVGVTVPVDNSSGGAGFKATMVASDDVGGTGQKAVLDAAAPAGTHGLTIENAGDNLIQLLYSQAQGRPIALRWISMCQTNPDGTTSHLKSLVLCSQPEADGS